MTTLEEAARALGLQEHGDYPKHSSACLQSDAWTCICGAREKWGERVKALNAALSAHTAARGTWRKRAREVAKQLSMNGADFISETNADETIAEMVATAITAAEARGREECAKIADDFVARAKKSREHYRGSEDGSEESCLRDQLAGMEIAIAIRAGGGR